MTTQKIQYPIAEHPHSVHGVPGRMLPISAPQLVRGRMVHRAQLWRSASRPIDGFGTDATMFVEIRFDDSCANGHQSFAITADVYTRESRRRGDIAAGGCLHDEIARVFPELAHLIRWHLASTDSPMHYVANAIYHASDRDHSGRANGEPIAFSYGIRFDDVPVTHRLKPQFWQWLQSQKLPAKLEIVEVAHRDNGKPGSYQFEDSYTFSGYDVAWTYCPFDDKTQAEEMQKALESCVAHFVKVPTAFSEGKARDFDAAREAANWPEATDEQLSAEPEVLKAMLLERLPKLQAEFRQATDAAGFLWEPAQNEKVGE